MSTPEGVGESQQSQTQQQAAPAAAAANAAASANTSAKHPVRVILLVESTAAAATNHKTARKWVEVLLKRVDSDAKQTSSSDAAGTGRDDEQLPKTQYALIVYGTCDRSTQAPVQCSSWCSSTAELFDWMDGVQFVGGSSSKGTALTQALAQAIVMSKCPYPDGSRPAAAGRGCWSRNAGV